MRVVCVDDTQRKEFVGEGTLQPKLHKGTIYTVRWSGKYRFNRGFGPFVADAIRLEEVVRYNDIPWGANRFRPLDESRLDQFRVHLNPKKVEEKIDA